MKVEFSDDVEYGTWNYRVIRYASGELGLHEVYYFANGKPRMRSPNPVASGDTLEQIREALAMMTRATENLDPEKDYLLDFQT